MSTITRPETEPEHLIVANGKYRHPWPYAAGEIIARYHEDKHVEWFVDTHEPFVDLFEVEWADID